MRSMASISASSRGIAAIVGVGPNLGLSIVCKFAHEGYTVAILVRDLGRLLRFAEEIAREEKAQVFAVRIDCSDSRSVREDFEGVLRDRGAERDRVAEREDRKWREEDEED